MNTLESWLGIRPEETKSVFLAALGAFLILGFMIVARSLREAFYLTSFDVKTLPYITAAAAVLRVKTGATLFFKEEEKARLKKILGES